MGMGMAEKRMNGSRHQNQPDQQINKNHQIEDGMGHEEGNGQQYHHHDHNHHHQQNTNTTKQERSDDEQTSPGQQPALLI